MKPMHKRLLVLLAAVLLLVSVMGVTAFAAQTQEANEPVCYEHGDVNSDGSITGDDAVYLLFASFGDLFGDQFPLGQSGDLDGDGNITGDDAVYLLFASFGDLFGDQFPLKGTIHNYFDPIWTWDTTGETPAVQVSLKCACGQPHTISEGITVTAGTVTEPTCVAAGSQEYTAKVTYNGTEFENTVTVTIPAKGENGHSIVGEPTCESGAKCANCDYEVPALGHSYAVNGEKVEDCKHTKLYKCTQCQKEIEGAAEGDVYYTHSYTAKIETEATCSEEGKKLLTCSVCGDTQEEAIPVDPSFHVWGEGVTENGVTTYTCACGQTKTAVQMDESGVSADDLKENEVELEGGTTVALDEATADQLDTTKTVVISVTEVDPEDTNMDAEDKAQVGDNAVYDFSMQYSDGTPITEFEGEVTVALPYELQEGDDVNSIDVWYIADDGSVECVKGVYNNGYVTFKTTHFSYYTVTRLTPAQRCAVYGHVNVTATKAATCTEDGYSKVYCQRCGAVESDVPALMLGHSYKKDTERSVDATCDAPGKTVSVCEHCKGEKEEDVKQLTHDWEKTETVEPDCTSKGHDKHACKLCKKEKTNNEQEAKGHNWQVAENGWQWAEDYSKATVTLTCSHKNTHTKVLTAVVTKDLDGSVCTGGEAAYTATASFNKVTYTDTVTAAQTGVGHTPDSKWEISDSQHYHLCTVCGEKVGAASHTWERTVNTAATCDKAGSATDKCAVCDKEKAVVLPATGEHSFVNGVCSVCGYSEGSCDHKRLHRVEVDLSQYGACEGYVILLSCDCGKISQLYDMSFGCDFEESADHDEENYYHCWTNTCKICGLVAVNEDYRVVDQESCSGSWINTYRITVGDTVVTDVEDAYYSFSHPVVVEHDPVKLADYGLCGGTVTLETCPCGERSYVYTDLYDEETETSACDWVLNEAYIDNNTYWEYTCSVCGAVQKVEHTSGRNGCEYFEKHDVSYVKNGAEVYGYTESYVYEEHSYKATSYELYGETCEDGVYIEQTCSGCGKTEGSYYTDHMVCVEQEVIDTTGVGFCSDAIAIQACPCGAYVDYSFRYADGAQMYHSWDGYGYDETTGVETSTCLNCGYKRTIQTAYGEKDENCHVDVRHQYTFADDKGHSFAFATYGRETQHELKRSFVLKGDSCEDGLEIKETCKDCGHSDTWTTNWHNSFEMQTLDLTQYGYCGQTVTLTACPCGYYSGIGVGGGCNWTWIDGGVLEGGGQFHMEQCTVCGIIWRQESVPGETDDPCKLVYHKTHSFLKDDQTLGSISYDYMEESHRYVYELKLNEGAVDCTGGYSYTATCQTCGYTYTSSGSGCMAHPVAREMVQAEGICGDFEKITYRCACGRASSTQVNSPCSYEESFVEPMGWMNICPDCGSYWMDTYVRNHVEGTTCQWEQTRTTVYYTAEGEEIVSNDTVWTGYEHSWFYTYTLLGESCDDGWTYGLRCADCGETETYTDTYYGCETNPVSREVAYENEAICGPVYVYRYACACGAEERYDVSYSCQGSWEGQYFTCSTCGLQQTNSWSYDHISGTCRESVTMEYTFLLNGETVATVEKTFEQADHIWLFSYQLLGESCTDGYTVNLKCAFCDESESWSETYYGHETRRTEYYELPENACGGQVEVVSCACGQERRVEYSHENNFRGTSYEETDENGIVHHYIDMACSECGMTMLQEWYNTAGADACHPVHYVHNTWKLGDWELSLSGRSVADYHDYETVSVALREGSVNCEDGVTVLERCKVCGYESTYTTHSHIKLAAETIDLGQYGSVCGGTLNLMKCACGADQGYEFSEDTLCDLDEKYTDNWIEGVLNADYYTTEGWQNIWSYSYLYTCAVTDPACAMQIRMSRYWLNENCTAVQYETWQLGYDADTGTCLKEITVATGETCTYHPHESVELNYTSSNGQSVSGWEYTCPDCGSYYSEESFYNDEGRQDRFVRYAENTLDNGEGQQLCETWVRVYYNDLQYTSLQRYWYIRADGTEWWYENAYTYDFTDGCKQTRVYTDSNGYSETYTEEAAHHTSWSIEWIKDTTCTQYGKYVERYTCDVCGEVTNEWFYDAEPNAHSWQWDSDKQTYVCYYCDLESANGSSGSIVMEIMSTDDVETDMGNWEDTDWYVIGYWNRGEVEFAPYVSLILYDAAEGENDEIVIEAAEIRYFTVEENGVCALAVNKMSIYIPGREVLAEMGYTGTFAARISFVPLNSTDTLDYAITFDTLTAE